VWEVGSGNYHAIKVMQRLDQAIWNASRTCSWWF